MPQSISNSSQPQDEQNRTRRRRVTPIASRTYAMKPIEVGGVSIWGQITERGLQTTISLELADDDLLCWQEIKLMSLCLSDRYTDIKNAIQAALRSFKAERKGRL